MGKFKVWSRPTRRNLPRHRSQRTDCRQSKYLQLGREPVDFAKRFDRDSMQAQLTYGQGLFRYFNDDFQNNDAAFNSSGNLTAIPAFGAMIGYTHKWTDKFRSTASYGYVHLDNQFSQQPDAGCLSSDALRQHESCLASQETSQPWVGRTVRF